MPAPPLNDRQRVEIAVPCRMAYALVAANCFGPDPDADPAEAAAEMERTVARLKTLLTQACVEPLDDLAPREAGKITRRIERVATAAMADWDDQPALSLAMALYYFLRDLIEREVLILWEGSAMGEAMGLLFPMFEHGFAQERLDASTQKRARRLLTTLQAQGYYRDPAADRPAAQAIHALAGGY